MNTLQRLAIQTIECDLEALRARISIAQKQTIPIENYDLQHWHTLASHAYNYLRALQESCDK